MQRQQLCIPISQLFALTWCTIKLSIKIQILINIIIEVNRFSYNYLTVAKIIDKNDIYDGGLKNAKNLMENKIF